MNLCINSEDLLVYYSYIMHKCRNLYVEVPRQGLPYGKCCLMKEYSVNFVRIAEAIKVLDDRGNVMPNGECPFFDRDIDQALCPCYV